MRISLAIFYAYTLLLLVTFGQESVNALWIPQLAVEWTEAFKDLMLKTNRSDIQSNHTGAIFSNHTALNKVAGEVETEKNFLDLLFVFENSTASAEIDDVAGMAAAEIPNSTTLFEETNPSKAEHDEDTNEAFKSVNENLTLETDRSQPGSENDVETSMHENDETEEKHRLATVQELVAEDMFTDLEPPSNERSQHAPFTPGDPQPEPSVYVEAPVINRPIVNPVFIPIPVRSHHQQAQPQPPARHRNYEQSRGRNRAYRHPKDMRRHYQHDEL